MKQHFTHHNNKGFTLIEILMTIAIVGGVVTLIIYLGVDISRYEVYVSESLNAEGEFQQALNRMIPEFRSIGAANNGGYPIVSVASSSFQFYSDIDSDGLFEEVRYFLDGTTLKKGVIKPTLNPVVYDPATENVTDVVHNINSSNIFYYYNSTYDGNNNNFLVAPIDVSQIRSVKAVLSADNKASSTTEPVLLSTFVNLRNLR